MTVLRERRSKVLFQHSKQSGEFSSRATKSEHFEVPSSAPCLHQSARSYWQHLLCAHFLQSLHTPSSFLGPHYRARWGEHAPFRHKHQHGHTKSELAKKAEPQDTPKGPLQIIVSIADQRISLYDNGALIARSSVSTGVQGHPTPLGVFSVISKE